MDEVVPINEADSDNNWSSVQSSFMGIQLCSSDRSEYA